jgi:hypothetical protein
MLGTLISTIIPPTKNSNGLCVNIADARDLKGSKTGWPLTTLFLCAQFNESESHCVQIILGEGVTVVL